MVFHTMDFQGFLPCENAYDPWQTLCYFYDLEMDDIGKLYETVKKIHTLKEHEWIDFSKIWTPVSYKRKTILTTAGETEKYLYFVLDGVQRAFYLGAFRL